MDVPVASGVDSPAEVDGRRTLVDALIGYGLDGAVRPPATEFIDRTVTLALPKTGLDTTTGTLYLADISIPRTVYERLDIEYDRPFGDGDWIRLEQ